MKKLVLFDFDGVLVNTAEFCYKIHKDVNGALTWERFQEFGNGNWGELIDTLKKDEGYVPPTDFYERYDHELTKITIHDILRDTVHDLHKKYTLAIISSTEGASIAEFIRKQKLDHCFSDIMGSDTHRSKVVKIKMILEKENVAPADAVFITDTLGDLHEANEAGIRSIGVTWGLQHRETLQKGNPAVILDDPSELLPTIEKMLE